MKIGGGQRLLLDRMHRRYQMRPSVTDVAWSVSVEHYRELCENG